jgi:site-specific recombinase XerC
VPAPRASDYAWSVNTPVISLKTFGGLLDSPLRPHVEHYVTSLQQQGYRTNTVAQHVYWLRRFGQWLQRKRLTLENIDEKIVADFIKRTRPRDAHGGLPQMLRRLLGILRSAGETPPPEPVRRSPAQCIADGYREYLRMERNLVPQTVENYSRYVEKFLIDRFGAGRADLRHLKLTEVIGFVRRTGRERNPIFTKGMVVALRAFLRYLFQRGKIEGAWAPSVPAIAHWHLTGLPKRLPSETVERILAACDQTTSVGRRAWRQISSTSHASFVSPGLIPRARVARTTQRADS